MKMNDILLIGGLAVGAYFLYKMLSGGSLSDTFGGGGYGGGGYATAPITAQTEPITAPLGGSRVNIVINGKQTYTGIPSGIAKASIPVLAKAGGQLATMRMGQPKAPYATVKAPATFAKDQIAAMKANQLLTFMSKYGGK